MDETTQPPDVYELDRQYLLAQRGGAGNYPALIFRTWTEPDVTPGGTLFLFLNSDVRAVSPTLGCATYCGCPSQAKNGTYPAGSQSLDTACKQSTLLPDSVREAAETQSPDDFAATLGEFALIQRLCDAKFPGRYDLVRAIYEAAHASDPIPQPTP